MINNIIAKTYTSVASLIEGMMVTIKYLFSKPITMEFPEQKWTMPERYRGPVTLTYDSKGNHKCIACMQCVRICPNNSMELEFAMDENKKRKLTKFTVEQGKCMFCGLCAEVCPTTALELGKEYELATFSRKGFMRSLLQEKGELAEQKK